MCWRTKILYNLIGNVAFSKNTLFNLGYFAKRLKSVSSTRKCTKHRDHANITKHPPSKETYIYIKLVNDSTMTYFYDI